MATLFLEDVYQNAVDAEVERKSSNLKNLESNSRQYQREIAAYEELKIKLDALSESSKELYGFRSPFRSFLGTGDGIPDYFTVTAERTANDSVHEIEVKQVAKSQKFSSKAYNMNDELPSGTFVLKIGEEEKTIEFEGGKLKALQQSLLKAFGKTIKITITQKSRNLQILTMDLVKTGAKNIVEVVSDDSGILTELNMFRRRPYRYLGHTFNNKFMNKWRDDSDNVSEEYSIVKDFIILNGINKVSTPLDKEAEFDNNIEITLSVRINDKSNPTEEPAPIIAPSRGISIPDTGTLYDEVDSVVFGDIELFGEGLTPSENNRNLEENKLYNEKANSQKENTKKEEKTVQNEPEVIDPSLFNTQVIGVRLINKDGEEIEKFFDVPILSASWENVSIPIGNELAEGDIILDVILINNNANYEIHYKDLLIQNTVQTEDAPNFAIENAQDSRISINGIDVLSENNEFSNVLDGLSIIVKKVTNDPMITTIRADEDKIIDAIVYFLNSYNDVISLLNETMMSPLRSDIREELSEMNRVELIDLLTTLDINFDPESSDDSLRKKLNYVGVFNGNTSISSIQQKIYMAVIDTYATSYGEEITLLEQIGISRGGAGEDWKDIKKGYLQVDEDKFMEIFETKLDGIEEIFANDTDSDSIPDTGVAYSMSEAIRPYTQTRGVVENAIIVAKERLKTNGNQVSKESDKVASYRDSREAAYYNMQAQLKDAERERSRMESMQRSQNNN